MIENDYWYNEFMNEVGRRYPGNELKNATDAMKNNFASIYRSLQLARMQLPQQAENNYHNLTASLNNLFTNVSTAMGNGVGGQLASLGAHPALEKIGSQALATSANYSHQLNTLSSQESDFWNNKVVANLKETPKNNPWMPHVFI